MGKMYILAKYCFISKPWRVNLTSFGCWDIQLLDSGFCASVHFTVGGQNRVKNTATHVFQKRSG